MFCLVIQWLAIIFTLVLDWLTARIVITHGPGYYISNPVDNFFELSVWGWVNNILSTLVITIADAFLVSQQSNECYKSRLKSVMFHLNHQVYRCYIVCGGKKWILAFLGAFLFADIGELLEYAF